MAQQDSIILLTSNSNNNIYFSKKKKYLYFKDSNGYEYELTKNVFFNGCQVPNVNTELVNTMGCCTNVVPSTNKLEISYVFLSQSNMDSTVAANGDLGVMSDGTDLKGNLYIYTKNTWKLLLNLGQLAALQGPKGAKGDPSDPLTIKYIVANESELNLLSPSFGEFGLILASGAYSSGSLYVYDGSWKFIVNLSSNIPIRGPQGKDGVSLANVTTRDSSLLFQMSDGDEYLVPVNGISITSSNNSGNNTQGHYSSNVNSIDSIIFHESDASIEIFLSSGISKRSNTLRGPKGDVGIGIKNISLTHSNDSLLYAITLDNNTVTRFSTLLMHGVKGEPGIPGSDGTAAAKGDKGVKGDMIVSANVSDDILSFTMNTGTIVTAGSVKGTKGDIGGTLQSITLSNGNLVFTDTQNNTFTTQAVFGPTGPSGPLGPTGAQGIKGQAGETILSSYISNGELIIVNSSGKLINLGNVKGDRGYTINSASFTTTGELLLNRSDGTQLVAGNVKGEKGPVGSKGQKGEEGEKGAEGGGFSSAFLLNGELNMVSTKGVTSLVGKVTGDKGIQGSKGESGKDFKINYIFSSATSLMSTTGQVGDLALISNSDVTEENARLYVFNGSTWEFLTDMSGAKGLQGPLGEKGEKGKTGETGIGQKGDSGSGIDIKYVFTSVSLMNSSTNNTLGEFAIINSSDSDNGKLFYYSGSSWIYLSNLGSATSIIGSKGDKGVTGANFDFQYVKSSVNELLAVVGTVGDFGLISSSVTDADNGKLYQYQVNGWTLIANISGTKGGIGDKGSKGSIGADGQKGETGAAGQNGTKGDVGPQGIGEKGQKGEKGTQGFDGDKGQKGTVGNVGPIGEKGESGVSGSLGATGAKGSKGDTGLQGLQGTQGDKGDKGQKGSIGTDGQKGAQGSKGQKGEFGFQGEKGSKGEIGIGEKGQKGAEGSMGQKGSVGGGITGAKGQKGQTGNDAIGQKGEPGEKGANGLVGPTGLAGPQGPIGSEGLKGEIGQKGDIGIKGEQGNQGLQGIKGEQGIQGIAGATGLQGLQGESGSIGSQGSKGQKGDSGNQGLQGDKGDQGQKGSTGDLGNTGIKGEPGIQGLQGDKGEQGQKGNTGNLGNTGIKGDPGIGGATGSQGQKGEPGVPGAAGDKGSKGDRFSIDHVVSSISQLSGLNASVGNFAIINSNTSDPDNSKLYVYDGSSWNYQTDMSGIQGNTGAAGPKGNTGAVGPTGATSGSSDLYQVPPAPLTGASKSYALYEELTWSNFDRNPLSFTEVMIPYVDKFNIEISPKDANNYQTLSTIDLANDYQTDTRPIKAKIYGSNPGSTGVVNDSIIIYDSNKFQFATDYDLRIFYTNKISRTPKYLNYRGINLPSPPATLPSAPQNIVLSNYSISSFTITFQAPANVGGGNANISDYKIVITSSGVTSGATADNRTLTQNNGTSLTYTQTGLITGNRYLVTISAKNDILSSYGTEASITSNYLEIPDPPTFLASSSFPSIFNVNAITKLSSSRSLDSSILSTVILDNNLLKSADSIVLNNQTFGINKESSSTNTKCLELVFQLLSNTTQVDSCLLNFGGFNHSATATSSTYLDIDIISEADFYTESSKIGFYKAAEVNFRVKNIQNLLTAISNNSSLKTLSTQVKYIYYNDNNSVNSYGKTNAVQFIIDDFTSTPTASSLVVNDTVSSSYGYIMGVPSLLSGYSIPFEFTFNNPAGLILLESGLHFKYDLRDTNNTIIKSEEAHVSDFTLGNHFYYDNSTTKHNTNGRELLPFTSSILIKDFGSLVPNDIYTDDISISITVYNINNNSNSVISDTSKHHIDTKSFKLLGELNTDTTSGKGKLVSSGNGNLYPIDESGTTNSFGSDRTYGSDIVHSVAKAKYETQLINGLFEAYSNSSTGFKNYSSGYFYPTGIIGRNYSADSYLLGNNDYYYTTFKYSNNNSFGQGRANGAIGDKVLLQFENVSNAPSLSSSDVIVHIKYIAEEQYFGFPVVIATPWFNASVTGTGGFKRDDTGQSSTSGQNDGNGILDLSKTSTFNDRYINLPSKADNITKYDFFVRIGIKKNCTFKFSNVSLSNYT